MDALPAAHGLPGALCPMQTTPIPRCDTQDHIQLQAKENPNHSSLNI